MDGLLLLLGVEIGSNTNEASSAEAIGVGSGVGLLSGSLSEGNSLSLDT